MSGFEMKVIDGVRVRPEDVAKHEARAKARAAADKSRRAPANAAKPANKAVTPDADKASGGVADK